MVAPEGIKNRFHKEERGAQAGCVCAVFLKTFFSFTAVGLNIELVFFSILKEILKYSPIITLIAAL